MKKKRTLRSKFILYSYIMLLAVLPATLIFSKLIGNKLGKYIEQIMRDTAGLCAEMIERQYESDVLMLEGLAVRMAVSFEGDVNNAMERLISTAERYQMKRISFSYPDGFTVTTDHITMDLTGVDNFERAIRGETLLTNVIEDVSDNSPVNVYSVPVFHTQKDEILGVMSAVYQSETFEQLLAVSFFEGEGYTYIMDETGDIIINSNHENSLGDITNFYDYMEGHKAGSSEQLKDCLLQKGEGFAEIERNKKENLFVYYKKLDIGDWYVLSMVPKNVAENTKVAVMFAVLIYCVVISWISLFVVFSIRHAIGEKNKLLREALYVDELTGGRSYEKFRIDCIEKLKRLGNQKAAFVFLDIDNFNLVSTLYGHDESVDTIRRVYAMILNCIENRGIIGRNSSDQFCVMYFYDTFEEFEQSIQRFIKTLHDNAKFANMLRPSMGIYLVEDPKEPIYDMMNKARTAHETIKQNEGIVVAYYDAGFRDMKYQDKHMEDEMEAALERHEFVPYIQPKYETQTGRICGAEALIRWITPEGKIIAPGRFIPLAENSGFVRQLDREMFYMVCRIQKHLLDNGKTTVPISVNVSRQLLYDKNFANDYCSYVEELGIPANLVELEITESAFFEDIDLFRSTLERLRTFGFPILMDDFGTGYSSLTMLHTMPIDVMKLDKSFIDDYEDAKGSSIIQCVLNLAKQLDLPVVAEGVETEEQYLYLKEIGCEAIQGFYFSKPMPTEDFLKTIAA